MNFKPIRKKNGNDSGAKVMDMPVSRIGVTCFVISIAVGLAITGLVTNHPWPLFVTVPIGAYLLFAIKVADQWEKAVVLRLGKYAGLRGPGMFHIIPIVDTVSRFVDQRSEQSGRSSPSCDEHAVRSDQGEGIHGYCSLVGGGNDGSWWKSCDRRTRGIEIRELLTVGERSSSRGKFFL